MVTLGGLTLLFTALFVSITLAGIWLTYRRTWVGSQRWMEATRHQNRLALIIGRWIWFKWTHLDCQYWILHLNFGAGPIEVHGTPPAGCYWSFTYNTWSEVNSSINSENVVLADDGSYRITFDRVSHPSNWIPVRKEARLGVIYFRIYESSANFPTELPEVRQNGLLVTRRAWS